MLALGAGVLTGRGQLCPRCSRRRRPAGVGRSLPLTAQYASDIYHLVTSKPIFSVASYLCHSEWSVLNR